MRTTLADLTWRQLRRGEVATRAHVTAPFASSTYARRRKRLHMVDGVDGFAVWVNGELRRIVVALKCGAKLAGSQLHTEAPEDLELCDYCALADLGPGAAAASAVIARLQADAT